MKKALAALLLPLLLLTGCSARQQRFNVRFFAMDTLIDITLVSNQSPDSAFALCRERMQELDGLFASAAVGSDVYRLNHASGEPVPVSEDTISVLLASCDTCRLTDGAFNIATKALTDLWGFETDSPAVPPESAVQALLPVPGPDSVHVIGSSASLDPDVAVQFGAIAKGYASDSLTGMLKDQGISSALLSLGGNIAAVGTRPEGGPWRVAIQDPFDPEAYLGVVEVSDKSVITSGSYQRYFTENGRQYHHILNPETGRPADSGLSSVTVISDSGTYADAFSTAFFVLGLPDSVSLYRRLPEEIKPDAILFVGTDRSVTVAGSIRFTPEDGVSVHYLSETEEVPA